MKSLAIAAAALLLVGAKSVSAAGQQAPRLKQTDFPDGTGSVGLPNGWQLGGAYRGSVQCTGPNGSGVVLGMPWTILRPDSSVAALPASGQTPMARTGDLATALREVVHKSVHCQLKSVRSRQAPSIFPGVPAVYYLYDYVQNGKTITALGYFTALDYGPSTPSWQLYSSAVAAPKEHFVKLLPTMLAIWKSWRPNGQAPKAGSESAKLDEILKGRRESFEKIQEEFRKLL